MVVNLLLLTFVTIFGSGDAGATVFPLLKVPIGPRACAMGETYTGLADDAGALFWNPAGLAQLNRMQFGFSHHEWIVGTRDENLVGAIPLGPGFLGAGAVHSAVRDIETWDPENNPGPSVTAHAAYAAIGYALRPIEPLYCGIALKGMYDNLVDRTGYGGCADIGLLYRPFRWLAVGLAGRNLGPDMRYGATGWSLPAALRLGASISRPRFRLLVDANAPIDNSPDFHLGGEYDLHPYVSLRGGVRLGPQDWRSLGWQSLLTGGCGIHYDRFALDYAIVPYGQLGLTHRIALRINFKAQLHGRVAIRVVELGTNKPVVADLTPEWVHQGLANTDEEGTFMLEGVEPGWLKVTAQAADYHPATESILVEPHTTHRLRLVMRRSGSGSLWGAVYDATTQQTLSASIRYDGPAAGSVAVNPTEGSFVLRQLPAGDYSLTIIPDDSLYSSVDTSVTVDAGRLTSVTFQITRGSVPAAPEEPGRATDEPPAVSDEPEETGSASTGTDVDGRHHADIPEPGIESTPPPEQNTPEPEPR